MKPKSLLTIQRLILEGDESRTQEYLDNKLKKNLHKIAVYRQLYIRAPRAMNVASEIVDFFDTYRDGQITFTGPRAKFNDELLCIAEEIRDKKSRTNRSSLSRQRPLITLKHNLLSLLSNVRQE